MLKPVTFKAAQNFKANLYALEVRSRFTDQNNANGYYNGYGNNLAATVVGTSGITIGSGALLVQGRMIEVVFKETVSIAYQEGKVGYIICRIETSPATNVENCSLVARVGTELSEITLTQEDTYAYASEKTNKIYELPIYSFVMQNTQISSVEMLIKPFSEFKEMSDKIDATKEELSDSIAANKTYTHHISFEVGYYLSSSWVARIYCDIPMRMSTPIASALAFSQQFWGLFGNQRRMTPCYGYYYSEKKIPCFIEYDTANSNLVLKSMNVETGAMSTHNIVASGSTLNMRDFSDTVL